MPNLKLSTYQVQQRLPGATDIASAPQASAREFGAGSASGLKDLASGLDTGLDRVNQANEQAEVSDVNAKMAQTRAAFTTSLAEKLRTATPGDKTIADTFVSDYDSNIDKMRDGISTAAGQRAFTAASSELRADLYTKANAGQAELMGVKARNDYATTLNSLSSSLIEDPSDFQKVVGQHQQALQGLVSTGMLPAEKAAELNRAAAPELAKSAVRGWIKLDPDGAEKDLTAGKWNQYLDGDATHQLLGEVRQQKTANQVEAKRQQDLIDAANQKKIEATQNDFLAKMAQNNLSTREILDSNLPAVGLGSKEHYIKMLDESSAKNKLQRDSSVFMSLFDRVHGLNGAKPMLDEAEILPYVNHGIDIEWANVLRTEMQNKKTTEGANTAKVRATMIDSAKDVLAGHNPVTGIADPDGPANYSRFLTEFLKEWDNNKKQGITDAQMTDPSDTHYMGYRYRSYMRSNNDIQSSMLNSLGGQVGVSSPFGPPLPERTPTPIPDEKLRKPGETPAEYLKRRGLR